MSDEVSTTSQAADEVGADLAELEQSLYQHDVDSQGALADISQQLDALPSAVADELQTRDAAEGEGETVTYTVALSDSQVSSLCDRLEVQLYATVAADFLAAALLGALLWRVIVGGR